MPPPLAHKLALAKWQEVLGVQARRSLPGQARWSLMGLQARQCVLAWQARRSVLALEVRRYPLGLQARPGWGEAYELHGSLSVWAVRTGRTPPSPADIEA